MAGRYAPGYGRPLRVLVTGAGAPGAWGLIGALRAGADRPLVVVGVDMNPDAVGFAHCDRSHVIPRADAANFWPEVRDLIEAEKIDVVLPLVTRELGSFARNKADLERIGCIAAVSSSEAIDQVNDKGRLLAALAKAGIPTAAWRTVDSLDGMKEAARELGYPDRKVVIKPRDSNGSRGVRVLGPKADRADAFLNEKPSSLFSTLDEVVDILADVDLPPYLVMEHLRGPEYSVDCLGDGVTSLVTVPRSRDAVRSGISFAGTVTKDDEIIDYCRRVVEAFRLWGPIGLQLMRDRDRRPMLIEANPRLQGTTALSVAAGINFPWLSVLLAIGEPVKIGPIDWGCRVLRYWGDMFRSSTGRLL